jgi:hypothetical protein
MEECLPNLLVRFLIVEDRVIERAEEFLTTLLMPASIRQFFHESAYCIIVSDRELMRVTSHDRTSFLEIVPLKPRRLWEEQNSSQAFRRVCLKYSGSRPVSENACRLNRSMHHLV